MHSCDTPACVKIGHLSEGSPAMNQADKVAKGRQLRGEQIHSAKLTEADVREIRRLCVEADMTLQEIGDRFSVDMQTIASVRAYRTWKHLDPDLPRLKKRTMGERLRELSASSGVSVSTIEARRARGLTGDALIAPKHRAPRKEYTRQG